MSATAYSVVEPSRTSKSVAGTLVILYALITMIPLYWIFSTALKTPPDSIAYPPKVVFSPRSKAIAISSPPAPGRRTSISPRLGRRRAPAMR